mmetsp:Transcript_8405/g.26839  ORF Transcript_8405/g.26839 Transcript_8405/m.26839 type:complete len:227 (+) Transcript_8405:687-1367(+)
MQGSTGSTTRAGTTSEGRARCRRRRTSSTTHAVCPPSRQPAASATRGTASTAPSTRASTPPSATSPASTRPTSARREGCESCCSRPPARRRRAAPPLRRRPSRGAAPCSWRRAAGRAPPLAAERLARRGTAGTCAAWGRTSARCCTSRKAQTRRTPRPRQNSTSPRATAGREGCSAADSTRCGAWLSSAPCVLPQPWASAESSGRLRLIDESVADAVRVWSLFLRD